MACSVVFRSAKRMDHAEQCIIAPALGDIVAHLAGLKIGNHHLRGIARANEAPFQIFHRQQLLMPQAH